MARVHSPLEACGSQGGGSSCRGPTVQPPGARQQTSCVSSFPSSRVDLGALRGPQLSVCARRALSPGRGRALGRWCPPWCSGVVLVPQCREGREAPRRARPQQVCGRGGPVTGHCLLSPSLHPTSKLPCAPKLAARCSDCQPARASHTSSKRLLCAGRGLPRAGCYKPCLRSGLFGLPPCTPLPQAEDTPVNGCQGSAPAEGDAEAMQLACPEPPPAGSLPPFPPYFEGAPFPPPLWLRNTYRQWVPQPPPRTIKRTRRRLSRNREPGRLALSPICLRPRRILCEKCKSTLSPPEASPGPPAAPRPRRAPGGGPDPDREPRKHEDAEGRGDSAAWAAVRGSRKERRREEGPARVPRSPAIKISYSTPQGTGEVVEIPSRVHGSLEPFCPPQDPEAPRDRPPSGPAASIPKLKLTRPVPPGADLPPPKIRLKPHRPGAGEQEPVYRAELVEELAGRGPRASSPALPAAAAPGGLADVSSGSSGEDDDCRKCPQGQHGPDGRALLAACPRGSADRASELVWSSDSLDESRSSSSDTCDPSSSKDVGQTVPPLTVRLHTQSVSRSPTMRARLFSRTFRRRAPLRPPWPPFGLRDPACLLASRVQTHARPAVSAWPRPPGHGGAPPLDVCFWDPDFSFPGVEPQEPGDAFTVTPRAGRVAPGPWAPCGAGRALVVTQAPLQAAPGLRGLLPSQPSGAGSLCT